jgi:hypothetical protein
VSKTFPTLTLKLTILGLNPDDFVKNTLRCCSPTHFSQNLYVRIFLKLHKVNCEIFAESGHPVVDEEKKFEFIQPAKGFFLQTGVKSDDRRHSSSLSYFAKQCISEVTCGRVTGRFCEKNRPNCLKNRPKCSPTNTDFV